MDFGAILGNLKRGIADFNTKQPSVIGNLLTGREWNDSVLGNRIAKPIPEQSFQDNNNMALQGFYNREALGEMNTTPSNFQPKTVQYPESLANAPIKEVKAAAVSPTQAPETGSLWENLINAVRETAPEKGYDPDTIIKQKALESDFGRSDFATERNNFGGIGAYDRDPNQAFNFKDITDYLNYYYKLIESRYPKAYENRDDPTKFISGLKEGGYASDPNYVWKVLNTPLEPR